MCFPRLFAGGRDGGRRIAEHPGAGRPARSAASVMHPVAPGFYVGARLAQINRKSFQYGKADPNARWIRRVDTVTRTGIRNRCSRSVDGWIRRQHGGYREVLEPALHHAIEGMGQCAQPEPEYVDVPEAAGASVQEPIVLLFLDPVFGRAPVAVHRFVDRLRVGLLERGDDEATVVSGFADRRRWTFRDGLRSAVGRFPVRVADRLSRQPFGLGDHAAFAAPAVARAIAEALVAADRSLCIVRIPLQPIPRIVHQRLDPVFQPIIAWQSQPADYT